MSILVGGLLQREEMRTCKTVFEENAWEVLKSESFEQPPTYGKKESAIEVGDGLIAPKAVSLLACYRRRRLCA